MFFVGLFNGVFELFRELGKLGAGALELGFELHHPFDTGEVQTFVGQRLDSFQHLDVGVAVAAATTVGSSGHDEAFALVDTQCLGMHAGQLGRYGDDVDGPPGCHDGTPLALVSSA